MKLKKWILSLLLSTFAFVVMHDFVITYIDPDTQAELCLSRTQNIIVCKTSQLHEHIHHALLDFIHQSAHGIPESYLHAWVFFDHQITFTSIADSPHFRPPIA